VFSVPKRFLEGGQINESVIFLLLTIAMSLLDVLKRANCAKYRLPVRRRTLLDVLREVNDCREYGVG